MPTIPSGPDYGVFAGNKFGVQSTPIDFDAVDAPTSKTYHGITLAVNGKVIGRVQGWNTTGAYARKGEHIYELSARTWGKPVDYVPGHWEGLTIVATVAEMWYKEIEAQLGIVDAGFRISDLIEQGAPFTAHEFWFRGRDASPYNIWVYRGCWLTDRNESDYTSTGNARVVANFNFSYVSRQLVAGGGGGAAATNAFSSAV